MLSETPARCGAPRVRELRLRVGFGGRCRRRHPGRGHHHRGGSNEGEEPARRARRESSQQHKTHESNCLARRVSTAPTRPLRPMAAADVASKCIDKLNERLHITAGGDKPAGRLSERTMPSGNESHASRHSPMTQGPHVIGIDAGAYQDGLPAGGRHGSRSLRSAWRRRQPAGGRRARGGKGSPSRHGRGNRRPRSNPVGHLPRHRRRRSPRRLRGGARDHAEDRLQGARPDRERCARRTGGRRAPGPRASSSSPAPGRSHTAATRRTKPPVPAGGATCSATRVAATGSDGQRCARCCAESDHRGQKTAPTPLLLKHFGIAQAQGLLHEVYYSNLRPSAIGSLAQCVEAAFRKATVRRSASFEAQRTSSKRLV